MHNNENKTRKIEDYEFLWVVSMALEAEHLNVITFTMFLKKCNDIFTSFVSFGNVH